VATSGNYERFVEIDGKRLSHIVDPRVGRPVERVAAVTVITPSGTDSDVFSTAVFVQGPDLAEALVKKYPDTRILLISLDEKGATKRHQFGWIWDTPPVD